MTKPEWGTKRLCPSCGARFYDMKRTPVTCPGGTSDVPIEPLPKAKKPAPAKEAPAPVKAKVVADLASDDDSEDGDLDVAIDDVEDIDDDDDDDDALIEDASDLEEDDDIPEIAEHMDEDLNADG